MKVVLNANSMEQNRRARKNASIGPSNTIEAILRIRPIQFDLHPERGRRRDRHRWGGRVEELQYRQALQIEPKNAIALGNLARVQIKQDGETWKEDTFMCSLDFLNLDLR